MDKTTTNANRQKKEATVASLSEKVAKAHGVVLTNYKGLTHKQMENFKIGLRGLDAEYKVTKNTLLKIAMEKEISNKQKAKSGEEKSNSLSLITFPLSLDQPTGTLFMYGDVISPLKALAKMIKDMQLLSLVTDSSISQQSGPSIKFGIVDGQAMNSDEILKLSALPSRDQLIAQFVGSMKSPLYGIHRALNWNMQKLVLTLSAIRDKK